MYENDKILDLKRFSQKEEIGKGQFGVVYLVEEKESGNSYWGMVKQQVKCCWRCGKIRAKIGISANPTLDSLRSAASYRKLGTDQAVVRSFQKPALGKRKKGLN